MNLVVKPHDTDVTEQVGDTFTQRATTRKGTTTSMRLRIKGALITAVVLVCTSYAAADVLWTLNNVTFADGGTATGSFTLDPGGNFTVWNIVISGGNTAAFPPITYSMGEPKFNTPGYVAFADTPFDRYTLLFFAGPLSNAGGIVPLTAGLDCNNGPCRVEATGQLDGVLIVPEPGALMLFGSGLVGLGVLLRRKLWG